MHTATAERARLAETVECCRDVYPARRVPKRYQGVRAGIAYAIWLHDEGRGVECRAEMQRLLDEKTS